MANPTIVIDGEEEEQEINKTNVAILAISVLLGIGGVVFGFIQMSEKNQLSKRVDTNEQVINNHVAEVEALKKQLEDNGIKPNITTTTKTETVSTTGSNNNNSNNNSSSDKKEDEKKEDKKDDKKETAGEGYSGYYFNYSEWGVKFEFPSGVTNLNYIPTENSITITSLTTASKTYDSDTCSTGFGQVILGGSGTKVYQNGSKTYNYVAPSNTKCSGADYQKAVELAKKLLTAATKL